MARLSSLVVALSTSVFVMVGCAVAPADESAPAASVANENADSEGADEEAAEGDEAMPMVEASNVGLSATGMNCACPAGQQYQNGLCYPACAAGWSGEGPVCWKPCASGFTDTGWFCNRSGSIIKANTSSCPWYNKCGLGSSCSKCPSGYAKDGCTCRRDPYIYAQESYGRGAGTAPSCSSY
jgi:hypothetical protein